MFYLQRKGKLLMKEPNPITHAHDNHSHLGASSPDSWLDNLVSETLRKRKAKWKRQTPKWLRPQCGAKTRAGGRCKATPVWNKETDSPVNGRCRMHGGLSTGARTPEGKKRALANLKQFQA